MNNPKFKYLLLGLALFATAVGAVALKPTHRLADQGSKVDLETMIPKQFGDWQEDIQHSLQVINPQVQEKLDRIYSQTLTRNYLNSKGERIMLSIAYGEDQSDAKQLHYPEVCYPSQGFEVVSTQTGTLKTGFGDIRVKRLLTVLGSRTEPLTYWTTVGNKVVIGGQEAKLEQLRFGFQGEVPDGLLFRVSSITPDAEAGYALQQAFLSAVFAAIPEKKRVKLAGFPGKTAQRLRRYCYVPPFKQQVRARG